MSAQRPTCLYFVRAKLSCALPCSHPADSIAYLPSLLSSVALCSSKIQVMTGAEGGVLSRPQTGGFWLSLQGRYILSQVLPGSYVGLSPWGGPAVPGASLEPRCLYSWCGPTKSWGLGWCCPRTGCTNCFPFLSMLNVYTVRTCT